MYICGGIKSPVTRKELTPEVSTGIDSVNLQTSKSFDFDFHCQLVFVDVLE